ncbi:MAG TPA: SDR family NAD(P)-dependent oxidoreductase [Ignavibacteriaceae bacterium]|nr:SDR family NAD(P)-dependent oxidoreductase [Ignavibacteriaceae bacterium]
MKNQLLKDKVVIVTGGSGGIGSAIVNKLASNDAKVCAIYHRNITANYYDKNICWFQVDITKTEEIDKLLTFTLQKYGKIDILINCAGYLEPGEFSSLDVNQISKMIELNLTSTIILNQKTLVIMKQQRSGHIINIGSLGGIVPMPYSAVYSATKFALRGFSFSLAMELKGTGLNLSLITPGSVVTKMLDYEAQADNSAMSFVSKLISPNKVADAVLKIIYKPRVELIIPRSQSLGSKLLVFSPKVFSIAYKLLHRLGLSGKRKYLNRYCNFSFVKGVVR